MEDGSERGTGRGSRMERETKTPTVDGTGETGQRFTASPADRQLDKLQSDRVLCVFSCFHWFAVCAHTGFCSPLCECARV